MNIFFDFDGTLSNPSHRHHRVYVAAIESLGGQPLSYEEYWQAKRRKISWPTLLEASHLLAAVQPQFLEIFVTLIEDPQYLRLDELLPGVEATLAELAPRHACYLVSLRRHPERLAEQLEWMGTARYFEKIISGHSEGEGAQLKASLIRPL